MESLFNKVASLKACDCMKKKIQHKCFHLNIAKFLRTLILKNIRKWLLLDAVYLTGFYMIGTMGLIKLVNACLQPLLLMVSFCIEKDQCHEMIYYILFRKDCLLKNSVKFHKFLLLLLQKY